ncbi:MAG: D-aminoacyl-tRNA deacylase [Thermoplasmata archaeon]|nr:D-aminoacyl-tRNA deacylase [Thermoplasmata archaeon]MCI4361935.1 D-aminoacyl-tRNA deacylase [Thermoplasmata archaeon]
MSLPNYVIVLSDLDPVASAVALRLGTGPSTGVLVDGAPVRDVAPGVVALRRPGRHIFDERLDAKLPDAWRAAMVPLVFPSVHRSERGDEALTVHPLGNPGPTAEVGGRPGVLTPAAPRWMADGLRRLEEGAAKVGLPTTYEATHHGPELAVPAFFIEVGGSESLPPRESATSLIADVVSSLEEDPHDRVVLGVGGGHYAPHFTDLTKRRSLAFGHILARHVLDDLEPAVARAAWESTGPSASGVVYARAADAERSIAAQWGKRFREGDAPRREVRPIPSETGDGARSAGT